MRGLFVLAVLTTSVLPEVAYSGALEVAREAAACAQRHADLYKKYQEEFKKADQRLKKIGDTDYAALCNYGLKEGMREFERKIIGINALKKDMCWGDIDQSVLSATEKLFTDYKKDVESDCKKAQQALSVPQSESGKEEGPCGAVVSKVYEKGGFKNGNVKEREKIECIKVGNKCTYRITFVVLRTGLRHPLSGTVEPGGTGKICADNESQTLQYVRWKKWGTIGR